MAHETWNNNNNRHKTHDYAEEMSASDRLVDTVSVDQTTNSTYSVNQVLSGAFDARANFQVIYLGLMTPVRARVAVAVKDVVVVDS